VERPIRKTLQNVIWMKVNTARSASRLDNRGCNPPHGRERGLAHPPAEA
jgi:hypothetical protein